MLLFSLLLVAAISQLASSVPSHIILDLDEAELIKRCPSERQLCHRKAAKGDCFGSSLRALVLQRQCGCSCAAVHHTRIQGCCRSVGEKEMKFCLPLCGYNTTTEDLASTLGIKCISQLTTWAYCAADAFDNSLCCEAKGVPGECRSFCQGTGPTCDMQSIFAYQSCLQHMRSIIECQKEGLGPRPRFDPEWSSPCDWEGK